MGSVGTSNGAHSSWDAIVLTLGLTDKKQLSHCELDSTSIAPSFIESVH